MKSGVARRILFLVAPEGIIIRKKALYPFQEKGKLILYAMRLLGNLAIRPAKHAPVQMHEAILAQQLILIVYHAQSRWLMPL
jgi:hypothetical protein